MKDWIFLLLFLGFTAYFIYETRGEPELTYEEFKRRGMHEPEGYR